MSSSKAISAVTNKLVNLLGSDKAEAKPIDKAEAKLNVFLYHIAINPAWRNQDLPTANGRGQPRRPLLPVTLYYLISAFQDKQSDAQIELGNAMLKLHDNPILTFDPESGIKNQTDPIRLTIQPMSLDEMSKLWSTFQTPYRPSVAYEAGVVLMESELLSTSPMPVTRRGEDGLGWKAQMRQPAVLSSIKFQSPNQPGMRLGESISLVGQNLNQEGEPEIVFQHPFLSEPLKLAPIKFSSTEVATTIPDLGSAWPAGLYTVCIKYKVGNRVLTSNVLSLALLPEIVVPIGAQLTAVSSGDDRTLQLPCKPSLKVGQRVELLIGSNLIDTLELSNTGEAIASWNRNKLNLAKDEAPFARLRVDGVDSLVYDPNNLGTDFDSRFQIQGL